MSQRAIFICYRRDDTADVAGRVHDILARRFGGRRIFKDVDSLQPGVAFGMEIQSVLSQCRCVLVLIGREWVKGQNEQGQPRLDDPNDWVRVEIETALNTPGVEVIPVLVNRAEMPGPGALPQSLRPLIDLHAATLRRDPDFHVDAARLTRSIEASMRAPARKKRAEAQPWLLGGAAAAIASALVFVVMSAQAPPPPLEAPAPPRADLIDRNGILLATNAPAYALKAWTQEVDDADATADALLAVFPDLDMSATRRRLHDRTRTVVYLRRGLTAADRGRVQALDLGGIGFDAEERRTYPLGSFAAHTLGFTDASLAPLAGVERGLDERVREASEQIRALRLSLDARLQTIIEEELARAGASAWGVEGGAALLVDGRSGETLAIASWPTFDPSAARLADENARRDRAAGQLIEVGAAMAPFTVAFALDRGVTTPEEQFDLNDGFSIDGVVLHDRAPIVGPARLEDIVGAGSNIGTARLAIRVGAQAQHSYLDRLGLLEPATLELGHNLRPLTAPPQMRADVAALGNGYGLAVVPAALASSYTVFVNDGERAALTLEALAPNAEGRRTRVFSAGATRSVRAYLRRAVTDGLARDAEVEGLELAGVIDERTAAGPSSQQRFSTFAGVFPASAPRYVLVLTLQGRGGQAEPYSPAAETVARIGARLAPLLLAAN